VATGRKSTGAETAGSKPEPLPGVASGLPIAAHGKEGVSGSSPEEGLKKRLQRSAFTLWIICTGSNVIRYGALSGTPRFQRGRKGLENGTFEDVSLSRDSHLDLATNAGYREFAKRRCCAAAASTPPRRPSSRRLVTSVGAVSLSASRSKLRRGAVSVVRRRRLRRACRVRAWVRLLGPGDRGQTRIPV